MMDMLDIVRRTLQSKTLECENAVTNEVTKRTKSRVGLADYLRTLDLWEPHGPRELPPPQPFDCTDPNYGTGWALWWAAIDRRDRQYRQGVDARD